MKPTSSLSLLFPLLVVSAVAACSASSADGPDTSNDPLTAAAILECNSVQGHLFSLTAAPTQDTFVGVMTGSEGTTSFQCAGTAGATPAIVCTQSSAGALMGSNTVKLNWLGTGFDAHLSGPASPSGETFSCHHPVPTDGGSPEASAADSSTYGVLGDSSR